MGTIHKRPNGAFSAKVRRKGYPSQSRTFRTKKDAERWIMETEVAISRACFVDMTAARQTPLREAFIRYAAEVSPTKRGTASERFRLAAMQRDPIASYTFATLKPSHVAAWRDNRLRSVSGSTVNREMNLLHHVFEVARKEWGIGMPVNPVSQVRRPKSNPPRDRLLKEHEKALLLTLATKNTRSPYLRSVLELAWETGMRQGELAALEIDRVDLEERVISLRAGTTKSGAARTVPLSTRAVAVLREIIGNRTAGSVWPNLTTEAIKRAFIRLRERAGIPHVTFHDGRHAATTHFVELGLSDMEVMSITGHSSTAMLKRYTHLRAKKLAEKLG